MTVCDQGSISLSFQQLLESASNFKVCCSKSDGTVPAKILQREVCKNPVSAACSQERSLNLLETAELLCAQTCANFCP